jgi:uncharacterized membrane protein
MRCDGNVCDPVTVQARISVDTAGDMVLLLGTTEVIAKEAAGVIANLVPHNRSTLLQAGAVEGLMQVPSSGKP